MFHLDGEYEAALCSARSQLKLQKSSRFATISPATSRLLTRKQKWLASFLSSTRSISLAVHSLSSIWSSSIVIIPICSTYTSLLNHRSIPCPTDRRVFPQMVLSSHARVRRLSFSTQMISSHHWSLHLNSIEEIKIKRQSFVYYVQKNILWNDPINHIK